MRLEVKPSERSTAEAPLWTWRVWEGGREVAFGVTDSEDDAAERAEIAAHSHRRWPEPWSWGP